MINIIPLLLFLVINFNAIGQKKPYHITTIAFYNLENLFDCTDDPVKLDEDYTSTGKNQWNEKRLSIKIEHLAQTISKIGTDINNKPPSLLGVAEIENIEVLEQLISHKYLEDIDYGIAHFNSPDIRGIDVALLYDRNSFTITNSQKHQLNLKNKFNEPVYSRDQLCVSGYLGEDLIYCIVNHWPSRRGGQKRSEIKRVKAAKLCQKITDSIYDITQNAKIIIMGDFNDNPTNKSLKKVLNTKSIINNQNSRYLYNPFEKLYKKGIGTLAYRDKWNLFDQIIISNSFLNSIGFKLYQAGVFNSSFLRQKKGSYKGYPLRTFSGGKYNGGYSDHFPVYTFLIRGK